MVSENMPRNEMGSDYEQGRGRESASAQRWLILAGGTVYIIGALWVSLRIATDAAFATISLGLLIASALVYGLTYLRERRIRLYLVPGLFALIYTSHIIFGIAYAPPGGAIRAAFLLALLGMALVALAPTLRSYLIAQGVAATVALYGVFLFWPATGVPLSGLQTIGYWLPAIAATAAVAWQLENARYSAFLFAQPVSPPPGDAGRAP